MIFIGWVVRPPLEEFFYVCFMIPNDAWTHVRGFKGTSLFVPLDRALRNQERRAEIPAGVVVWVRLHYVGHHQPPLKTKQTKITTLVKINPRKSLYGKANL